MVENNVSLKMEEVTSTSLSLFLDEITIKIKIDLVNKKIEKLKSFFEELIITSFLKETIYKIDINDNIKERLNAENKDFYNLFLEFINQYEASLTEIN